MIDEEILFPTSDVFDDEDTPRPMSQEGQKAEVDALRGAYHRLFTGQGSEADARKVMKDLYREGCGAAPTFRPDPREHAYFEGRRALLLRILRFSALDTGALFRQN